MQIAATTGGDGSENRNCGCGNEWRWFFLRDFCLLLLIGGKFVCDEG